MTTIPPEILVIKWNTHTKRKIGEWENHVAFYTASLASRILVAYTVGAFEWSKFVI